MIRRANQSKHGAPPSDLLVCFPSRAHLTLIPKRICSPGRLSDPGILQRRHLKKLPSKRLGAAGQTSSSPVLWSKAKPAGVSDESEPTSPKVTCAGQIKVRPRSAANCKSWQSVMEEIERIHTSSKTQKKRASWSEALGFKKDVMQFLTCLRNIKLDFRCFGAMPECDISSDDDEEDDEEEEGDHRKKNNQLEIKEEEEKGSKTVFSKWFMVLEENQNITEEPVPTENEKENDEPAAGPPPNALLLMRCRSAPAKSWLENRANAIVEQEERDQENEEDAEAEDQQSMKSDTEEKHRKKLRDYLLVMEYDTDFYKLSNDIAKETWVVGSVNLNNPFSRSRSSKR